MLYNNIIRQIYIKWTYYADEKLDLIKIKGTSLISIVIKIHYSQVILKPKRKKIMIKLIQRLW